jgi:hypothetical protein
MKQLIWVPVISLLLSISSAGCDTLNSSSKPLTPPESKITTSYGKETQQLNLKIIEPDDKSIVSTASVSLSGTVSNFAELTVNGISIAIDDSKFNVMVELEEGPNSLEIRAADAKGNEETQVLTIIYLP